ncbi:MAG: hypothetical protein Q7K40_03325 [bacterium]|nr:hypothetical protein [bacterium]
MQEHNEYQGTGLNSMKITGLTSEERAVSKGEDMSFNEKVDKLRLGAETIVKNTRFALAIEIFSREHSGAFNLTEENCEQFLHEHPECPYEAAMVLAIAQKMDTAKKATMH